jgi:hypothetical protein
MRTDLFCARIVLVILLDKEIKGSSGPNLTNLITDLSAEEIARGARYGHALFWFNLLERNDYPDPLNFDFHITTVGYKEYDRLKALTS